MNSIDRTRDDKLRVTLFADAFADYTCELARSLAPLVDLTLFGPASWQRHFDMEELGSLRYVAYSLPRIRDPRSLPAALRLVSRLAAWPSDLLHVQASSNPWLNIAFGTCRLRSPVVETIHDVVHHPGDRSTPRLGMLASRTWTRKVHRFILHTQGLADSFASQLRIDAERIAVIPHGELGTLYQRGHESSAKRENRTILFYGRIWPYKGLSVLVDALVELSSFARSPKLIVAGDGEPIAPYVADLPSSITCEVHQGRIDDVQTLDLFMRATILCLPYVEASQSGTAAIGIGMGLPMVASNIGGLGETLRDQQDALLVEPNNPRQLAEALDRLLSDIDLQERMRAHQLDRSATDLSWKHIAELTLRTYQSAIA